MEACYLSYEVTPLRPFTMHYLHDEYSNITAYLLLTYVYASAITLCNYQASDGGFRFACEAHHVILQTSACFGCHFSYLVNS